MNAFTAAQRRVLEQLVLATGPLTCPACGDVLTRTEVEPSRQVAYVRRRVWLICPACRRSATVDIAPPHPGP